MVPAVDTSRWPRSQANRTWADTASMHMGTQQGQSSSAILERRAEERNLEDSPVTQKESVPYAEKNLSFIGLDKILN